MDTQTHSPLPPQLGDKNKSSQFLIRVIGIGAIILLVISLIANFALDGISHSKADNNLNEMKRQMEKQMNLARARQDELHKDISSQLEIQKID